MGGSTALAREAHTGVESLLASRLRPLSSKAKHPPNFRSLHKPYVSFMGIFLGEEDDNRPGLFNWWAHTLHVLV